MTLNTENILKNTIKKESLIEKDGHVVVGLSGGPDSMCLFHLLYSLREEFNITLSAVHLNHGFRPGFAEQDQEFVENYLKRMGIYCYSKTVDVNQSAAVNGDTPEEAGRNERYKAFDEEASRILQTGIQKDKIKIAVAQNRNDRAETILMRIMRGTGPDGLAGIPYKRKSEVGFDIIRPLLDVDRKDIEDYCNVHNLNPRRDHTNDETEYSRNKIRLDLIPKIKSEYNDNIEDALLRLSTYASTDKDYFNECVSEILRSHCIITQNEDAEAKEIRISRHHLTETHPAVSHRLINDVLKILGLTQGIEAVHIENAMNIINNGKTGKTAEFPSGFKMVIEYDDLKFYKDCKTYMPKEGTDVIVTKYIDSIKETETFELLSGKFIMKTESKTDLPEKNEDERSNITVLDYNKLSNEGNVLTFRYRKRGDKMSVKGMSGTKKIKDLFIDEKIPVSQRKYIPMVVFKDEVLWAVGLRKSDKYLAEKGTNESLLLEWIPNN